MKIEMHYIEIYEILKMRILKLAYSEYKTKPTEAKIAAVHMPNYYILNVFLAVCLELTIKALDKHNIFRYKKMSSSFVTIP